MHIVHRISLPYHKHPDHVTIQYVQPCVPFHIDSITRTGEGGIPCGDHVNCFVWGYFTSLKDE